MASVDIMNQADSSSIKHNAFVDIDMPFLQFTKSMFCIS